MAYMTRYDLIPSRNADGTIILRAVAIGPVERLRRRLRRLLRSA